MFAERYRPKLECRGATRLVWRPPCPMKLSPAQVEQFRRKGYVAVPGFFNAQETAALQADIARIKRNGFLRNVATAGDGKTQSNTKQNLQLCPANFYSTLIRALPFSSK